MKKPGFLACLLKPNTLIHQPSSEIPSLFLVFLDYGSFFSSLNRVFLLLFLRYFVIANAIASVYGFFVLFLPAESLLWRLVLCFDAVTLKTRDPFLLPLCFDC